MSKRGRMPHIRGRGRETVCFISGKSLLPLRRKSGRGGGGGASRDRTGDLKLAKLALSQLSYGPVTMCEVRESSRMFAMTSRSDAAVVGREGVEPSTSRLSGVRSNHLSYRPPCLADLKAAGGVSQLR